MLILPLKHKAHAENPDSALVPAIQFSHGAEEPTPELYLPAEHTTQPPDCASEYFPEGQSLHIAKG
jgi:hypothetical protein